VKRRALWLAALAGDLVLAPAGRCWGQDVAPPEHTATFRADSLRLSGRPWHAAETLLAAARRDPNPNAFLIVEGAKAEVHARRYEHARQLLAGQPWLLDYLDGEALAVLAQAEYGTGRYPDAATHFQMARARAPSARVPVLAVRAALAFDAAGQADSAAAAGTELDAYMRAYYGVPPQVMAASMALHAGTPESAAEWFAAYRAAGAQHLVVRLARPNLSAYHETARELLRAARPT